MPYTVDISKGNKLSKGMSKLQKVERNRDIIRMSRRHTDAQTAKRLGVSVDIVRHVRAAHGIRRNFADVRRLQRAKRDYKQTFWGYKEARWVLYLVVFFIGFMLFHAWFISWINLQLI